MSNNLPITLQTPDDIQEAGDYLRRFLAAHRSKQSSPAADGIAAENRLWAMNFIQNQTVAGIEVGLKSLLEHGKTMPVLEVQTAAPLTAATQQQLVSWLRHEVRADILIRPILRRGLVGGVVIRSSRRVYDMSVRQAFGQSRAVLTELVHAWS